MRVFAYALGKFSLDFAYVLGKICIFAAHKFLYN